VGLWRVQKKLFSFRVVLEDSREVSEKAQLFWVALSGA
jgi:hypothetical protein